SGCRGSFHHRVDPRRANASATMNAVKVKICGINDAAGFDAAIEAGTDYVGFVFFPPSPRYVTPAAAASLSARHPGCARLLGLFFDPSMHAIAVALETVALDVLQIYGYRIDLTDLRERFGKPVWRPAGISQASDL